MRHVACAVVLVLAGCGEDGGGPLPPPPPPPAGGCAGLIENQPSRGAAHVPAPDPISYEDVPPSSGPHRPEWGRWGEYTTIGPERWIHNLEHGGAALLYAESSTIAAALRSYARARAPDAGGAFRYILTPYTGLPRAFAVVTWTWTYEADAFCAEEVDAFLDAHYRKSAEDIAADGVFDEGWIAR